MLFLPVELIDDNGAKLRRIVLQYAREWGLEEGFLSWVSGCNRFCSTLVDRIVTGYPRDDIQRLEEMQGYTDRAMVASELFNLWVIEGKEEWAEILPIHKTGAKVVWTDDVTPYKNRKVRILNGGHTASVLAAYLAGHDTVLDMMEDAVFEGFLDQVLYNEVIPTLDLPRKELEDFASAVKERFRNPYLRHKLLDISLNSCSKWRARCLPSLLGFAERRGELPPALSVSLAAFILFYKGELTDGAYWGRRADQTMYEIRDDAGVLEFFAGAWAAGDCAQTVRQVLGNRALWDGMDLNEVSGLTGRVSTLLEEMERRDMRDVVATMGLGEKR